jgi:hypothetical protein
VQREVPTFEIDLSMTVSIYFSLGISLIALVVVIVGRKKSNHYPPGPKGLPIVGNVLDMPKSHWWVTYREWSRLYSM